ncbi:MAG: tetratricopeptide repeat protein [Chloroflexi bacterium]|nr:tetratricopeptide repeat protein [Chloroflexota bacterium]
MSISPVALLLLVGLLFTLAFRLLSQLRREGLASQFTVEALVLTGLGAAYSYVVAPLHPLLFLVLLYLITMRVRLLVDLGNSLAARRQYESALGLFRLAMRLRPDDVGRRIVLINRGVTQLLMGAPEEARASLAEALAQETTRLGAKYLAAGFYNLGLACQRLGQEAEAIRRFNQAIDAFPASIYARAAEQALKRIRGTG